MGIPLSRENRVSAQFGEKKAAPDSEFEHLSTVHELLNYKEEPQLCVVEPLSDAIERGKPDDPRTIVCHDMDGDYKAAFGCCYFRFFSAPDEYLFHHWQVIDAFVCYSHHMVTMPPLGWISAAHKHGVKVLGSFILKEDDTSAINMIQGSLLTPQVAAQLVNVATVVRFDGWVIGIGCNLHPSSVPFVEDLLKAVTTEMHQAIPGSLVIWYDAVDVDGNVKPHNELNGKNACFLDLCDGILLNFRWTEATLRNSAQLAGSRKGDVYVGIDVYARSTPYPGGYDMYNVRKTFIVREYALSAAIIGADWVYKQNKTMFRENKYLLWALPEHCSSQWRLKKLPLSTTFCQGFGASVYKQGRAVRQAPWFDIAKQELQPRDQGRKLCGGGGSAMVCTDDAYTGGSCLCLAYERKEAPGSRIIPYFR
ncbi:hypothetical protein HPB50_025299 [Hyalomma asiaticum]|uniref:Uncharacterized protein n=1 Tax=Hyalomma asiaticum TaxID=266040 RepID=A0ACB7SL86_HYAAI|nr:hypothetical protein HPB50_025299 [Hyalomma asiaticum]